MDITVVIRGFTKFEFYTYENIYNCKEENGLLIIEQEKDAITAVFKEWVQWKRNK